MARKKWVNLTSNTAALITVLLLAFSSSSMACPESCFCFDNFVTCSDFQYLDLTLLPPATDTLVLSRGEVEEFPPGFLAMATKLKMLEIISVSARVVRGSAFRGLGNLDLFSITGSSFDIVEPDGFRGLHHVSKFMISDSKFGRVGKHAFAYINNILEIRIWNSFFDAISDEAFHKLTDILSFQLYQNNITYIGDNVFLGASEIDEVTIYMNKIKTVSEGSFENMATVTDRMVLYANKFQCSCDLAWMLTQPALSEYLASNECTFYGHANPAESTFRLSDITRDALCATVPSTEVVENTSPMAKVPTPGIEESVDVTDEVDAIPPEDRSTPQAHSVGSSHSSKPTPTSASSSHHSSSSSTDDNTAPPAENRYNVSQVNITETGQAVSKPTYKFTEEPLTSDNDVSHNTLEPSRKVTRVAPVKGGPVDNGLGGYARPYSTSAIGMTTADPDNSSHTAHGNSLFLLVLSAVSLLLISTPYS